MPRWAERIAYDGMLGYDDPVFNTQRPKLPPKQPLRTTPRHLEQSGSTKYSFVGVDPVDPVDPE